MLVILKKGDSIVSSMMEYNGYHATIEYEAEDNLFVGEVFGIADSLSFHGTSIEELEAMFHQSIDNYLEMCKSIGKEPNKEFKGTFNVRLSPELHRKAAIEAAKNNITLNQFVANAIEKAFEVNEASNKETIIYVPYSPQKVQGYLTNNYVKSYRTDGVSIEREEVYSYV